MNYHVFIVNDVTFNYHLKYMFAGTGAKDRNPSFLVRCDAGCHPATEDNLVGMIADISRIRVGDKILFICSQRLNIRGCFMVCFKLPQKPSSIANIIWNLI